MVIRLNSRKNVKSLKGSTSSSLPQQINSDTGLITGKNSIIVAFNHHLISAGYLFEITSKPLHNDIGLDAARGNLLNDQRNDSQRFSFWLFTEKEALDAFLAINNIKSTRANQLDPGLLNCAVPIIDGSVTPAPPLPLWSSRVPGCLSVHTPVTIITRIGAHWTHLDSFTLLIAPSISVCSSIGSRCQN